MVFLVAVVFPTSTCAQHDINMALVKASLGGAGSVQEDEELESEQRIEYASMQRTHDFLK